MVVCIYLMFWSMHASFAYKEDDVLLIRIHVLTRDKLRQTYDSWMALHLLMRFIHLGCVLLVNDLHGSTPLTSAVYRPESRSPRTSKAPRTSWFDQCSFDLYFHEANIWEMSVFGCNYPQFCDINKSSVAWFCTYSTNHNIIRYIVFWLESVAIVFNQPSR